MEPLQNNNQIGNVPAGNAVPAQAQDNEAVQSDSVGNPDNGEAQNNTDRFTSSNNNNNSEGVNKKRDFSWGGAFKSFLKGLASPILTMIKNPFETLLILTGGLVVAAFIPALIPLMIYGGIGFGVFQLGKAGYNVAQGIKEKDGEKIENAFENFGNGTFDILTLGIGKGIITRGFKLFGKFTNLLIKETAKWYKGVFFSQVASLNPTALACVGLNVVEGVHVAHSAATLSAGGTFLGLSAFIATKYLYMGVHYRQPIAKAINFFRKCSEIRKTFFQYIRNGLKEAWSQSMQYIFRGNKSVPLGTVAENAPVHEVEASVTRRLREIFQNPEIIATVRKDIQVCMRALPDSTKGKIGGLVIQATSFARI